MTFKYPIITNLNFETVEDFSGPKPLKCDWRNYGFKRDSKQIRFYADFAACPCIYYIVKDGVFCFSFDVDNVVEFANENGIKLSDTFEGLKTINANIQKHIKKSILARYKYGVQYIEGWESVSLNNDGTFAVVKNSFQPFTLDVANHYNELKHFLLKYKNYVDSLIDDGLFIPTITGGLDTRYLLGLCRHRVSELNGYYLKEIKPDGKGDLLKGSAEAKIAEQVALKIGLKNQRFEKQRAHTDYTISGMFNENANSYDDPNDPQYLYKIIQHGWSNKNFYCNIMPFMDEEYLQFKQKGELMRILFALLLTPDLIYIPLISGSSLFNQYPDGYCFTQLQQIDEACLILGKWGWAKVKNILVK